MDSLIVLIPVSLLLVGCVIFFLVKMVHGGQFENLEEEGKRIFDEDFN